MREMAGETREALARSRRLPDCRRGATDTLSRGAWQDRVFPVAEREHSGQIVGMSDATVSSRRRPWAPVRPLSRLESFPAGVLLIEPHRILSLSEGDECESSWRLFTDAGYETRAEYAFTLCGNAYSTVYRWARARGPRLVALVVPGARRDPGSVSGVLVTGAMLSALSEAPVRPRVVLVPRTELPEPTPRAALGWLLTLYREHPG